MEKKDVRDRQTEVTFRLQDAMCPDQDVILAHLESSVEVIGKVQFFSDGGAGKEEFAIIEVPGIAVPLVVPRDRLRFMTAGHGRSEVGKSLAH